MRTHSGNATEAPGATDAIEIIELIDLIDVGSDAFGQSHAPPTRARPPRRPPRWRGLALVSALFGTAVVVVLQPWHPSSAWRTFPVTLAAPTLPRHQVQAEPASPVVSVLQGNDRSDEQLLGEGVGHVFAADGATITRGEWAWFRVEAVPTELTDELPISSEAAFLTDLGSQRQQLVWSPEAGRRWTVETHQLSAAATRTFATAVGVHDGHAALRSGYSLQSLQPVAGIAGLVITQRLLDGLVQGAPLPAATVVRYRSVSAPTSVATTRAPDDAASAVRFLLGGTDVQVGDQPAVVATTATLGTVVVWVNGGRMVVLTGPLAAADQMAVAAAVRAATVDDPPRFDPAGEVTALIGSGVTADGRVWEATVRFGLATDVCVVIDNLDSRQHCVTSLHATLAAMTYITTPAGIVVVALSNAPRPGLVRLTTLDGRRTLLGMRPLVWNLSAAAFQPSPGQSYELVIAAPAPTAAPVEADGRLRPDSATTTKNQARTAYVLDSPLVTPYSADIPTQPDDRGQFQAWVDESQWLTAQASPTAPTFVALDAERRVVDGVELTSRLADPTTSTATVPLTGGWWLTVHGSGLTDVELVALLGEFRMVDQVLVRSAATANRPADLSTSWGSEALLGAVFAQSSYLTANGEFITLHVGERVGGQSVQRRVFPLLVGNGSDGTTPAGGLLLSGTLADTGEHIVTWAEGDLILSLTGRISLPALATLADSVRPAPANEWRDLLVGLRPSFRLGQFATVATTDEWRAGLQLATRNGDPQYLWWWSAPGNPRSTASTAVPDDPLLGPVVDTVVVPGATYVFVAIPDSDRSQADPVIEARQGDLVVPLELERPFPDLGFRVAVARFDSAGAVSVWVAGREVAP